jgi:hypothetical protein
MLKAINANANIIPIIYKYPCKPINNKSKIEKGINALFPNILNIPIPIAPSKNIGLIIERMRNTISNISSIMLKLKVCLSIISFLT